MTEPMIIDEIETKIGNFQVKATAIPKVKGIQYELEGLDLDSCVQVEDFGFALNQPHSNWFTVLLPDETLDHPSAHLSLIKGQKQLAYLIPSGKFKKRNAAYPKNSTFNYHSLQNARQNQSYTLIHQSGSLSDYLRTEDLQHVLEKQLQIPSDDEFHFWSDFDWDIFHQVAKRSLVELFDTRLLGDAEFTSFAYHREFWVARCLALGVPFDYLPVFKSKRLESLN